MATRRTTLGGNGRGMSGQRPDVGGVSASGSVTPHERRDPTSRWHGAVWALAIFVGFVSAGQCPADETLTLQGPSPQLIFDDNDGTLRTWTVSGNDGGFNINNTAGFSVFRIAPTASTQSLHIGTGGKVGIRTQNPQTNLHVVGGFTSVLRLDCPTDVGIATVWDLVSDMDTGFRLVDAYNNRFPFTVENNAPNGSLFVGATGSVGMGGGALPDVNTKLDLRSDFNNGLLAKRTSANAHYLRVENSNSVFRCGVQSSGDAQFGALSPGKGLNMLAGGATKMLINASGQISFGNTPPAITSHAILHQSGANLTLAGVWTNASSHALKQDIEPITSEQARDTVRALQPVGYRYKSELTERYVGFIAEDVPELVATNDRKGLAPMDITAVLTKVVQDQDRELVEQKRINAELSDRLLKLEQQLGRLAATNPSGAQ